MKKEYFFANRVPKFQPRRPPPYSIPLVSVLHQNKDFHNFQKQGQRSIVKVNKGLEYTLNDQTYFKNPAV